VIAFIFPGQGSQHVGMGKALADRFPVARRTFEEADAAFASVDGHVRKTDPVEPGLETRVLSRLCFEGPEDDLALTEITQPAILTASVAAYRVLAAEGITPAYVAGHSLGEYTAHVAAGTFAFSDAVALVRRRGRYMQEAVPIGTGAMAAILGGDRAAVAQACEESSHGEIVSPANINCPGQIVIAGHTAAVQRASERVKALGARRAKLLTVSAPFHCALMIPAQQRLEPELRALTTASPSVPVVANVDAEPKRDGSSSVDALVRQVSAPVQWEDVVRRLASEGVTTYVEVGPGNVLSGLVKKIQPDAHVMTFGSPENLEAIVAACSISAEK
jgi:[acyl-carrier-protein] S-malonyltransferase